MQRVAEGFDIFKAKRAAACFFDQGDGAFFRGAEQPGGKLIFRPCGAGNGDEFLRRARPDRVQRMGHQRFAGAGFAVDQHMAVGLPQIKDIFAQAFHHVRGADQLAHQHRAIRQLAPQGAVVQRQAAALRGTLGQLGHPVGVERLFQKIERADPHRLDGHRHVAMPGDHDHGQATVDAHQALQKGHAVHAGHLDVTDHHPRKIGGQA